MDASKRDCDNQVVSISANDLAEIVRNPSSARLIDNPEPPVLSTDPVPGTLVISVVENGVPATLGTDFEFADILNDAGSTAELIGTDAVSGGQVAIQIPSNRSGRIRAIDPSRTVAVHVEGKIRVRVRYGDGWITYQTGHTFVERQELQTGAGDAGGAGSFRLGRNGKIS